MHRVDSFLIRDVVPSYGAAAEALTENGRGEMTRKIVWRAAIALAATFALASCESTSNPSGLNTGELILQILGLSSGTDAAVTVTGPGGFSQNVTASGALANLTPGTYTITASPVASSPLRIPTFIFSKLFSALWLRARIIE